MVSLLLLTSDGFLEFSRGPLLDLGRLQTYLELELLFLEDATVSWTTHAKKSERENIPSSPLLSYFEPLSLVESWYYTL